MQCVFLVDWEWGGVVLVSGGSNELYRGFILQLVVGKLCSGSSRLLRSVVSVVDALCVLSGLSLDGVGDVVQLVLLRDVRSGWID
jgi:hypothetical protein